MPDFLHAGKSDHFGACLRFHGYAGDQYFNLGQIAGLERELCSNRKVLFIDQGLLAMICCEQGEVIIAQLYFFGLRREFRQRSQFEGFGCFSYFMCFRWRMMRIIICRSSGSTNENIRRHLDCDLRNGRNR